MAFPLTPYSVKSVFVPTSGIRTATSSGGATVSTNDYPNEGGTYHLLYEALSTFQKDEFISDHAENYMNQFSFPWEMDVPATNHDVYWDGEPDPQRRKNSLKWDVTVKLERVPS